MSLIVNTTAPVDNRTDAQKLADNIRQRFTEMAAMNLEAFRFVRSCLINTPDGTTRADVEAALGADVAAQLPAIGLALRNVLVATDPALGDAFDAVIASIPDRVEPTP